MRAMNDLGTGIRFVLVIDEAGKLFSGENLASESKSVLEPIERADAIRRLRQLITDNEPQAPPALAAEDSDFQIMQRRQSRRMMSADTACSTANSGWTATCSTTPWRTWRDCRASRRCNCRRGRTWP